MELYFPIFEKIYSSTKKVSEKPIRPEGCGKRGVLPLGKTHREYKMRDMFLLGKTMEEIGTHFEISRERVRQLLKKHFNIVGRDGGLATKSAFKIAHKEETKKSNLERRVEKSLNCSLDEFLEINGTSSIYKKGTISIKFIYQKRTAKKRGIQWGLSFKEWWDIWKESGKWELRGRGEGYCMARIGDTGGYEKDNVYICTIGQNFADSYLKHSQEDRRKKASLNGKSYKKTHCPKGHERIPDNLSKYGNCKICQKEYAKNWHQKNKQIKSLLEAV